MTDLISTVELPISFVTPKAGSCAPSSNSLLNETQTSVSVFSLGYNFAAQTLIGDAL